MSDGGYCRTALATPGLLNTGIFVPSLEKEYKSRKLFWTPPYIWCTLIVIAPLTHDLPYQSNLVFAKNFWGKLY